MAMVRETVRRAEIACEVLFFLFRRFDDGSGGRERMLSRLIYPCCYEGMHVCMGLLLKLGA